MTSLAISPYTMAAALAAADPLLHNPEWLLPENPSEEQTMWWTRHPGRAATSENIPEIQSNATTDYEQHQSWLKSHGWDTSVRQGSPRDLYLAAVLSVGGLWTTAGTSRTDQSGIARARLTRDVLVLDRRAALLLTQTAGVKFVIAPCPTPVQGATDLAARVFELKTQIQNEHFEDGEVDFPMVHLQTKSSAAYMLGLHTATGETVSQAAEGFELKMNHLGAKARAKAEMALTRGISMKPILYIEGPFLVTIFKEGVPEPLFAAYVDRDSWKDPGTL